ncbi:hypothetical protein RSAG8_03367, partial [Rhizoctonia solani AG-8 WAC10335]
MASPAPRAALKVFGIPELAYLICGAIQRRDNVNLMQACRELFYSILPLVWEEVDGPTSLVSMIPGGGVVSYESDLSPYVVMQLPGSLELSRFNIYAPHVKRLALSHIPVDGYDNWEGFLSCTRSVDLLPNLETIYFPTSDISESTTNSGKVDTDSVNWAIAFLSASLQTLGQVPSEVPHYARDTSLPWLDFSSSNSLVTSVAQKCLNLRSLSILPAEVKLTGPTLWSYGRNLPISFSSDSPETYSSFLQLGNLTSLLISAVILCPEGLISLSGLPRLESLTILGWENDRKVYCDHLQIPINAFPALKHLELNRLDWDTIFNLCDAKALIAGLESMTITHPHRPWDNEESFKDLSDIIALLVINNSSITALAVHEYRSYQTSPEMLNSWNRLPLVSLYIGWTVIQSGGFEAMWSILSCLPLLENLQLSMGRSFDLRQMKKIVETLPRLRRIQIPVEWESVTQLTREDFTPCRSQFDYPLHVKSNFYLPESQEGARQLARYLSLLRPTAPVICESFRAYFYCCYGASPGYIDEQPKDTINLELSRLGLK